MPKAQRGARTVCGGQGRGALPLLKQPRPPAPLRQLCHCKPPLPQVSKGPRGFCKRLLPGVTTPSPLVTGCGQRL